MQQRLFSKPLSQAQMQLLLSQCRNDDAVSYSCFILDTYLLCLVCCKGACWSALDLTALVCCDQVAMRNHTMSWA